MKSRLSNYLENVKLAKLHLNTASEYARKGQNDNTIHNMLRAIEYLVTANNNLASIAFGHKPKQAVQKTAVPV